MDDKIHSIAVCLLIFAIAVYALRWRSVAIRETAARIAVDNRLVEIRKLLIDNYEQARQRRLENEEQFNEYHDYAQHRDLG